MKKILVSLMLMSGAYYSYAQEDVISETTQSTSVSDSKTNYGSPKFGLGVTAGYNASTYCDLPYYKVGSGFNAGVTVLFTCLERRIGHLLFEASVLFSRECYKIDKDKFYSYYYDPDFEVMDCGIPDVGEVKEKFFHNFLKIPVQCGYEFNLGKEFTLGPKIGLENTRLIDKDKKYDIVSVDLVEGINLNYKRKFRFSLGWQSNIRTWEIYKGYNGHHGSANYKDDYVNFNANIAYLFF